MTDNTGRCVIILSYIDKWTPDFVREAAKGCGLIICADGGEARARECGLVPDCVIGDFDSDPSSEKFDCMYITYPAEKDLTDCEAALLHAIELGYRDITLIGGINGRLDHTIGNIAMLLKFSGPDNRIVFCDMQNSMTLLSNSKMEIEPSPLYKYFSICSVDSEARGVSIEGAKYPLDNIVLKRATSLGISNEIAAGRDRSVITVSDGTLLVVRSSDSRSV